MSVDPFDPATVRLWGKANGIEVSERGRISELVLAKFLDAGMPTREQIIEAHPELAPLARPIDAPPRRVQEPDNMGPGTVRKPLPEPVAQRGRKVLLPHHYDPRPSLFSGDQLAQQRFWNIDPVRALWTVAELEDLAASIGEPPLVATMNLGEQIDAEDVP